VSIKEKENVHRFILFLKVCGLLKQVVLKSLTANLLGSLRIKSLRRDEEAQLDLRLKVEEKEKASEERLYTLSDSYVF
jgi:hypothetical protein